MNLSDDVDLEDFVARPDKISGADIHSICQEAGMSYFKPISNSVGPVESKSARS